MNAEKPITSQLSDEIQSVLRRARSLGPLDVKTLKNPRDLARYIDHTFLKPEATSADIARVCDEAKMFGFAGVCVNSRFIGAVAKSLVGTKVLPVCVVGFPLGAMLSSEKAGETAAAVENGAEEIDMVLSIGGLKEKNWDFVRTDIAAVVQAAGKPVKVILETCLLTDEEKVAACLLSADAGATFVKTSTGFSTGGATVADVRLMSIAVSPNLFVKASGGVRDFDTALQMIAAGATRIGTSSGVALCSGEIGQGTY